MSSIAFKLVDMLLDLPSFRIPSLEQDVIRVGKPKQLHRDFFVPIAFGTKIIANKLEEKEPNFKHKGHSKKIARTRRVVYRRARDTGNNRFILLVERE